VEELDAGWLFGHGSPCWPWAAIVIVLCAAILLTPRFVAAEKLLVFAAASLTDVLRELGKSFEKTGHDTVTFNFGGSSDLARQITAGAPADVFFSADSARMEELEKAGLVDRGERRNVLSNALVIVIPTDADHHHHAARPGSSHDCPANPSRAAGIARKYLESLNLWDGIRTGGATLDMRAALAAVEAGTPMRDAPHRDAAISKR
jgi:molybdate transport system substrate-binding protein